MRFLNIHEFQGAQLLDKYGVNVPPGIACNTIEEVKTAAAKLAGASGEVVLKSQILAGGRGLGTFKNGFKGGVHIVKVRRSGHELSPVCLDKVVAPIGSCEPFRKHGPGRPGVNCVADCWWR